MTWGWESKYKHFLLIASLLPCRTCSSQDNLFTSWVNSVGRMGSGGSKMPCVMIWLGITCPITRLAFPLCLNHAQFTCPYSSLHGCLATFNPSSLILAGEEGRLMDRHLLLDYLQGWQNLGCHPTPLLLPRCPRRKKQHLYFILCIVVANLQVLHFCIFKNCVRDMVRSQIIFFPFEWSGSRSVQLVSAAG